MKRIHVLTTAVICFAAVFFSLQQSGEQLSPRQAEFLSKYSVEMRKNVISNPDKKVNENKILKSNL